MQATLYVSLTSVEVRCPQTDPPSRVVDDLFSAGMDCVAVSPHRERVIDGATHLSAVLGYERPTDLYFIVERLVRRFREVGIEVKVEPVPEAPRPSCPPMLPVLARALAALPALLADEAGWQSLLIDYEHPHVERLYRSFEGEFRVYLHDIHPCEGGEALFHAHPWGSAMFVFDEYEMGVGVGAGMVPPRVVMRLLLAPGTRYEMTHRDAWHYARPRRHRARTVMVTGPLWGRESPRPSRKLHPLTPDRHSSMIATFRALVADPHCRLSDIA